MERSNAGKRESHKESVDQWASAPTHPRNRTSCAYTRITDTTPHLPRSKNAHLLRPNVFSGELLI